MNCDSNCLKGLLGLRIFLIRVWEGNFLATIMSPRWFLSFDFYIECKEVGKYVYLIVNDNCRNIMNYKEYIFTYFTTHLA